MAAGRLKKYLIFAKSGAQTTIAYRGQMALWVIGSVINAVLMGLLWWAVYKFSPEPEIGGYTFPQMLMYVLLTTIVGEITYSDTMWSITEDVHYGFIGMRLMKPISYRHQLGFTAVGSFFARFLIIGVPMILVGTLVSVFGFGLTGIVWYNILLFIPACILSLLMVDAIQFLFGQLAFRTHAMFGVSSMLNIVTQFLSGGLVPLALFPIWAQNVLYYTPFPTLFSFPVRLFLGQLDWVDMGISFALSVVWILVINLIGQLMYKGSVRKVVVFGG
ncbi:MAG: hypothetical protein HDT28_00240 [Clostridiales bacterium]|nr:hypothetical protein [Clostridiales bacterium]